MKREMGRVGEGGRDGREGPHLPCVLFTVWEGIRGSGGRMLLPFLAQPACHQGNRWDSEGLECFVLVWITIFPWVPRGATVPKWFPKASTTASKQRSVQSQSWAPKPLRLLATCRTSASPGLGHLTDDGSQYSTIPQPPWCLTVSPFLRP